LSKLDVLGVGNAIVDVLAETDDAFLAATGVTKGAMTLIDTPRAQALYAAMPPGIEASGGSAANTMAGIASLGGVFLVCTGIALACRRARAWSVRRRLAAGQSPADASAPSTS